MAKTKQCTKCGKTKGIRSFWKRGRGDKLKSHCIVCCKKASAAKYVRRVAKDPNYIRKTSLKGKYGITLEEYDRLFEIQNGVCAICKTPETAKCSVGGSVRRLAVDHDHETGEVRGLLCSSCNKALGGFADNPAILAEAIRYLCSRVLGDMPVVPTE